MKLKQNIWVVLTCLATNLFSSSLMHAAEVTIRADEWCPMNCDPKSDKPGYMIEIAKTVLGEAGHTVNYHTMPWERAIAMTRKGEFDCIVGAYTDDAPDFVFPTHSLGLDQVGFFAKNESAWEYRGVSSLEQVQLGVIGGYAYDEGEVDAYIEGAIKTRSAKVQPRKGDHALEANIKKLLAGRVDALIESKLVFSYNAKKENATDKVKGVGQIEEKFDMYIACSPNKESSQEYTLLLSRGVEAMRKDGRLKAILDKYGLEDWR